MFKKKRIELDFDKEARSVIVPDIGNNLELAEKDQFKVVLRKIPNMARMKAKTVVDGHVVNDEAALFRAGISEIINPPIVNGDRELTIEDIAEEPDLYMLFQNIFVELLKLNTSGMDKKK